jgi:hypothetical protein
MQRKEGRKEGRRGSYYSRVFVFFLMSPLPNEIRSTSTNKS